MLVPWRDEPDGSSSEAPQRAHAGRRTVIAKVCFTGSVGAGRKIMELASASLTRVTLELGGNDPAVILQDERLCQCSMLNAQCRMLNGH